MTNYFANLQLRVTLLFHLQRTFNYAPDFENIPSEWVAGLIDGERLHPGVWIEECFVPVLTEATNKAAEEFSLLSEYEQYEVVSILKRISLSTFTGGGALGLLIPFMITGQLTSNFAGYFSPVPPHRPPINGANRSQVNDLTQQLMNDSLRPWAIALKTFDDILKEKNNMNSLESSFTRTCSAFASTMVIASLIPAGWKYSAEYPYPEISFVDGFEDMLERYFGFVEQYRSLPLS